MEGQILKDKDTVINPSDDYPPGMVPSFVSFGQVGTKSRDIIPLRTLLRAANIDSLETGAAAVPRAEGGFVGL